MITDRYPGFVHHQLVELGYLKSAHGGAAESVAFNLQPRPTGQLLLGSSRQFDVADAEVDWKILRRMMERGFELMPGLRGLSVIRVWTGIRAATEDNQPFIGPVPGMPKVYMAAGHEGLGVDHGTRGRRVGRRGYRGPQAADSGGTLPAGACHGNGDQWLTRSQSRSTASECA